MSRHPTATAGTVRVFNEVMLRAVTVPAYWRGKYFAVTGMDNALSSKPAMPGRYAVTSWRYVVTHLPTGCAVYFATALRRAVRLAKRLDSQANSVWGSAQWEFGAWANRDHPLYEAACMQLAAARRDAEEGRKR